MYIERCRKIGLNLGRKKAPAFVMQVGKTGKIVFKILIFQSAVVTAKREMKNVVGSHGLEN